MPFIITGKATDGTRICRDLNGQRFLTDEQIEVEAAAHEKNSMMHAVACAQMRDALAEAKKQD